MTEAAVAPRRRGHALLWVVLVIVVLAGGLAVASLGSGGGPAPLDPTSTTASGSRALDHVLAGYGARLTATRSLAAAGEDAGAVVAVLDPDAYSDAQLRSLAGAVRRVVLLDPGLRVLSAVSSIQPDDTGSAESQPDCTLAGAQAAGTLAVPGDAGVFRHGTANCYGGLVAVDGRVVALGSSDLLRNDHLGRAGVAALDVNLLTADRAATTVVWLQPGADADGPGATTVWALFPGGAHRAFVWLIVVGAVLVLWRARRLGPAVTEPLPVVVRAAELVEGHGRLYRRAHAVDRAAAALRAASTRRLAVRAGLPATASPQQVAAVLSPTLGVDPAAVFVTLAGPAPVDDRDLVHLADDLARLEATALPRPEHPYREDPHR